MILDKNIYQHKQAIKINIANRYRDWSHFKCENWYSNAQNDLWNIVSLFDIYGINYQQAAAICSALSPANSWQRNLIDLQQVLFEVCEGKTGFNYTTYGANVAKARELAALRDPTFEELIKYFKAEKTKDFFLCLLNPDHQEAFVIDRHMFTIAGIEAKGGATAKQYKFVAQCYKEVWEELNLPSRFSLAEFQAWLWCAYQHYFKQVRHY